MAQIRSQFPAFQLKGSLFALTVIHLTNLDNEKFKQQLEATVSQNPTFFQFAPVILDISQLPLSNQPIEFELMVEQFRAAKLVPVGVRGGNDAQKQQAINAGLAVLPESKAADTPAPRPSAATSKPVQEPKPTQKIEQTAPTSNATQTAMPQTPAETTTRANNPNPTVTGNKTKVITKPVRSGQQVYAAGGDLIVLAAVSHGAELLADGHIHVYGPLRGRALAGIKGDKNAHIFCQSFEAELIAIAGRYRVSEDLKNVDRNSNHIYLDDDKIVIEKL